MKESYPWEADGVRPSDDWAALILVRVHNEDKEVVGYVLVIEPDRPNALYKLPGGHKQDGETPLQTAVRELVGETGLVVSEEQMHYVISDWRAPRGQSRGHWSSLFTCDIDQGQLARLNSDHEENEGEVPEFFEKDKYHESARRKRILPPHHNRLRDLMLLR